MKRGKPLTRKTPLARSSKPRRGGLKREKMDTDLRDGIIARSAGLCDSCGYGMRSTDAYEVHHRKLRTRGGEDSWENLLGVCAPCHRWIHANPENATLYGLMVSSWQDPAETPILLYGRRLVMAGDVGWIAVS